MNKNHFNFTFKNIFRVKLSVSDNFHLCHLDSSHICPLSDCYSITVLLDSTLASPERFLTHQPQGSLWNTSQLNALHHNNTLSCSEQGPSLSWSQQGPEYSGSWDSCDLSLVFFSLSHPSGAHMCWHLRYSCWTPAPGPVSWSTGVPRCLPDLFHVLQVTCLPTHHLLEMPYLASPSLAPWHPPSFTLLHFLFTAWPSSFVCLPTFSLSFFTRT